MHRFQLTLPALALSLMSLGTHASPIQDFFPGRNTCWGRVYSAAHLAAQPRQNVHAIYLWHNPGQRSHFERLATNDDAAAPPTEVQPRLYVQPLNDSRFRTGDIRCTAQGPRLACTGLDGLSHDDRPTALHLSRTGAALQLDLQTSHWPLLTLDEHLSNPDAVAHPPLKAGASDRVFRLDPLPASECVAVERTVAASLLSPGNPPLSRRIENARSQSQRHNGRICLTGRSAGGMQLRLGFDTQAGDRADPIDEFAFDVVQERMAAPAQTAQSSLICRARDYAWRCEWRQFDDQTRHAAITFAAQTGMLIRRPGGAILRGLPCLGGRCDTGLATENDDIPLSWNHPAACTPPK